jgi:Flp pilus assembly protein TadD
MSKPFRAGSAVSLVALASMLAACAAPQHHASSASGARGQADGDVGLAIRALAALNANDPVAAVGFAERAADRTPGDAAIRTLLGNAYFAAGRFASAESAFRDSLSIDANQPQVVLKLALVEIGQGKNGQALNILEAGRNVVDPADYGLALALAGRASDAIAVLEPVARTQGASARVRQNLALAYAFAGDWTDARTVAAQDVPADQLDARIHQWMQIANPARPSDQLSAVTGIKPAASDPGQPTRLALVKAETRIAQAAPAPAPVPQFVAPAPQFAQADPFPQPEFAPPAPPPQDTARVPARVEAPVAPPAPMSVAMAAAASPEAPAAFAAMAARFAPAPKPVKARRAPAPVRVAHTYGAAKGPVMQLGAYNSPQYLTAAWSDLTRRYPALRGYMPLRARFDSPKGTFWRLSVQGFASQREAIARCQLLKNRGGNCFVRGFAGDAPVQLASR